MIRLEEIYLLAASQTQVNYCASSSIKILQLTVDETLSKEIAAKLSRLHLAEMLGRDQPDCKWCWLSH